MMARTDKLAPLSEASPAALRAIRLVASDIDGTMTESGKLMPAVLNAFERLQQAGIAVLPVTGRPAGEALGLARYLPYVNCAIAENGAVLVTPDQPVRALWTPPDRTHLLAVGRQIAPSNAPLVLTEDAFCRVGDVAYERGARTTQALQRLKHEATQKGVYLVWSSVHIHLSLDPPDKGLSVLKVAAEMGYEGSHILTIGDAPNDEGLWQVGRFGLTIATADIDEYVDSVQALADFRCQASGQSAWLEMVNALLTARS